MTAQSVTETHGPAQALAYPDEFGIGQCAIARNRIATYTRALQEIAPHLLTTTYAPEATMTMWTSLFRTFRAHVDEARAVLEGGSV